MVDFIGRIEYHAAQPGRILAGWQWDISSKGGLSVPTSAIRGLAGLPGLRIYLPDMSETFRPARHTDGIIVIKLLVATAREGGVLEWTQGIEKVIDALQTRRDGTGERAAIAGTVRHFDWKTEDNFILENSLNSHLSISLHTAVGDVGNHRNK